MSTVSSVLASNVFAFVIGIVAGVGGLTYMTNLLAHDVEVRGVVMYSKPDPTTSAPYPEGYYVTSTVFIKSGISNEYKGQRISGSGRLTTACGSDGSSCYPQVELEKIQ